MRPATVGSCFGPLEWSSTDVADAGCARLACLSSTSIHSLGTTRLSTPASPHAPPALAPGAPDGSAPPDGGSSSVAIIPNRIFLTHQRVLGELSRGRRARRRVDSPHQGRSRLRQQMADSLRQRPFADVPTWAVVLAREARAGPRLLRHAPPSAKGAVPAHLTALAGALCPPRTRGGRPTPRPDQPGTPLTMAYQHHTS